MAGPLATLGYTVEMGPKKADKVPVPVLFGRQGRVVKAFHVDAYSKTLATVIEI